MPGLAGYLDFSGNKIDNFCDSAQNLLHYPFYRMNIDAVTWGEVAWIGFDNDENYRYYIKEEILCLYFGYIDNVAEYDNKNSFFKKVIEHYNSDKNRLGQFLDGAFNLLILDFKKKMATIINDVFGHFRFFYLNKNSFIFSPEVKLFSLMKGLKPELDFSAVSDYFNYGYVIGDKTYFTDVKILPPASILQYSANGIKISKYFKPRYEMKRETTDISKYTDEAYAIFKDKFNKRTENFENLYIPISGGLDSRLILCQALESGKNIVPFSYGNSKCYEFKTIEKLKNSLSLENFQFIEVNDFEEIDRILKKTVWLNESMANLRCFMLEYFNNRFLNLDKEKSLFLNGIYGGPTNMSASYYSPEDLFKLRDTNQLLERVSFGLGRRYFSSDSYRNCFEKEFRLSNDQNYFKNIQREIEKLGSCSDCFGHRVDNFLIHHRLFRNMNQVDLNRYHWKEIFPLTSLSFYRFYLKCPEDLKANRILHKQVIIKYFPEVAGIEYYNDGMDLYGNMKVNRMRIDRINRIKNKTYKALRGSVKLNYSDDHGPANHWFVKNKKFNQFIKEILFDKKTRERGLYNLANLEALVAEDEKKGKDYFFFIGLFFSFELFMRQLEAGSYDAS